MSPKINILILEDFYEDAELMLLHLTNEGIDFDAKIINNKEDYILSLKSFRPDVILCDHKLPGFDSLSALEILKSTDVDVPFILVTGSVSEEFAVEVLHAGASDYLIKDRMTRLGSAIKNAIERKRTDKERTAYFKRLAEDEKLFKEAEKIAHFGVWETDYVTGHTKWSDETYRMLGFDKNELLNPGTDVFYTNVHPDDIERIKKEVEFGYVHSRIGSLYFRVIMPDGSVRVIKSSYQIERVNNVPVKITGFNLDVTEQKKAEELIIKSEKRFRQFFESAPEAVLILDIDKKVFVDFNDNAIQLLKTTRENLLNKSPLEVTEHVQPEGINAEDKMNASITKIVGGEKLTTEWLVKDFEGNRIFCEIRASMLSEYDKHLMRLSVIDITERKNAELERQRITKDLYNRNKDLEQFAYIVSHNLRAPVANILGFCEEIKNDDTTENEKESFIGELHKAVERLDTVITDLNDILNIGTTVKEIHEEVFFSNIVHSIKIEIHNLIEKNQVEIKTDFKAHSTFSIKSYMHSIFYNLISNSIKYRQQDIKPVIEIKSMECAGKVILTFHDNGMGINLEKRGDQVFGLYKRFHTNVEGKGIGLFMIKAQILALGGTISIESEINKGTKFVIELPLKK